MIFLIVVTNGYVLVTLIIMCIGQNHDFCFTLTNLVVYLIKINVYVFMGRLVFMTSPLIYQTRFLPGY